MMDINKYILGQIKIDEQLMKLVEKKRNIQLRLYMNQSKKQIVFYWIKSMKI